MKMEAKNILVALHEMEEIGWSTILKIVSHFGDLTELIQASQQEIEQLDITARKARIIRDHLSDAFVRRKLLAYQQHQIEVITPYDHEYPQLLLQTGQPPWVLYCKGNMSLLQNPQIGIVGTRVPTVYGKNVAQQLAASLASAGFCVVSGLARGIDSSAHRGAIGEAGSTIAVLGCGVDVIYPSENSGLYRDIAANGLIVSEYPLGTPAQPGLFPARNRIIAGLSLGVVVVEAALKSGSLITADFALEEARDVFAVPGPINSPKSLGALDLIKQGAKLITCVEDIIEEYKYIRFHSIDHAGKFLQKSENTAELTVEEQRILTLITHEPLTLDQLLEQSQTNFGHLHTILLSLTLKKKINQLPGSAYSIR